MRKRGISRTAVKIAKGLVYLDQDPSIRAILPPGAAEATRALLSACGLLGPRELAWMRHPRFRSFAGWVERHTVPGQSLHLAIRKRFVEDATRRAIDEGARQLLVVGAGFDTLGLRLAREIPELRCLELDHPQTQAVKRSGLESMGATPANLELVGVDLAVTKLDDALARSSWDASSPGVVICEGVLMYLDRSAVTDFFDALRRTSPASGSRVIFTCLRSDDRGGPRLGKAAAIVNLSLLFMGEPFRWVIADSQLGPFMAERSYRLEKSPTPSELHRVYLEPSGLGDRVLGDAEILAVASPVTP